MINLLVWVVCILSFNTYIKMQIASENVCSNLHWKDCDEQIDLAALSAKEPILFYDEVGCLIMWYGKNCFSSFILCWPILDSTNILLLGNFVWRRTGWQWSVTLKCKSCKSSLLRIVELLLCPVAAEVSLMMFTSTIILLQRVMPSCWFLLLRFWVSLLSSFRRCIPTHF